MNGLTKWTKIAGLVIAMVGAGGIATKLAEAVWLDDKYATHAEVSKIDDKLLLYTIEQEIRAVQERMWTMEQRWGQQFRNEHGRWYRDIDELLAYMSPEARKEYQELQARLIELQEERKVVLERMRNKKKG